MFTNWTPLENWTYGSIAIITILIFRRWAKRKIDELKRKDQENEH